MTEHSQSPRWVVSVATLLLGGAVGAVVVILERGGLTTRPGLGAAILILGASAALLPLRHGLFVAIVLAANQGFLIGFVGGYGIYWKEAFVSVLVLRALGRGLPAPTTIAGTALVSAALGAYVLAGAPITAVAWEFKILLLFAAAGWAVTRLRPGQREWWATYYALGAAVAGAVVVASWQRSIGVGGLLNLGYSGASIRFADDRLRVFGGFIYGAPFAYTLAIAILCWFALLLAGQTGHALKTVWMPLLATLGIVWSLNRIAVVGVSVAVLLVSLLQSRGFRVLVPAALLAALVVVTGGSSIGFLGQGFTFSSASAHVRTDIWSDYWNHVSTWGSGPASAGVGFGRAGTAVSASSTSSGVVDNLYLTWLVQYGLAFGSILCVVWLVILLRPLATRVADDCLLVSMKLIGVFFVVAALAVNAWEEFPVNFVLAIVLAQAAVRRWEIPAVAAELSGSRVSFSPQITQTS